MNDTIEFADGTRFPGLAAEASDYLLITASKETVQEHMLDFMDTKKTKKIIFIINKKKKHEYTGFTHFAYMEQNPMDPSQIVVRLRKAESGV